LKDDVLTELPEKRYTDLMIEISNRKEYNIIETDFINFYEENIKVLTEQAMKAKFVLKRNELSKAVIVGKMDVAIKWVENFLEEKKQIVIFTKHILPLTMLQEHFKNDIRLIYGAVKLDDRNIYVNMFQKGKLKIIAGNSAMAEGLTMTSASDMLFIEFAYSPMKQAQREDRIHRMGQKENVMIYKMIAKDTVDEAVISMQKDKNKVIQKTLVGESVKSVDDDAFMINEILKRREKR
jgi:SWI/SNF-related matrix-associated actin-dependent regulator 1 of chromatin subfamily A